ncbi:MAG: hypothetical protein R3C32_14045 [Chloroflexota bacterium]
MPRSGASRRHIAADEASKTLFEFTIVLTVLFVAVCLISFLTAPTTTT